MVKFYSEVGTARTRELVADVATWVWVALWTVIGLRIHDAISMFAEAGRVLQGGGRSIQGAGAQLGDALNGVPLVGEGIDTLATGAFQTAGQPFIQTGQELEALLLFIARLLALLVVAVMLVPWLARYLPWRAARLETVRAAHRAIRRRRSTCRRPPCSAPWRLGRSIDSPTPSCSSTRPTRSATMPRGTTAGWPRPSSRASGLR